jgi:hypothetical protein
MTLPNNSSMNYYPDNTLSNYITKLFQLFDLDGSGEVGLSEVLFPISWPANKIAMRILIWHKNPENYQYDRNEWVAISPRQVSTRVPIFCQSRLTPRLKELSTETILVQRHIKEDHCSIRRKGSLRDRYLDVQIHGRASTFRMGNKDATIP